MITGHQVRTSSWMPGTDWTNTYSVIRRNSTRPLLGPTTKYATTTIKPTASKARIHRIRLGDVWPDSPLAPSTAHLVETSATLRQ